MARRRLQYVAQVRQAVEEAPPRSHVISAKSARDDDAGGWEFSTLPVASVVSTINAALRSSSGRGLLWARSHKWSHKSNFAPGGDLSPQRPDDRIRRRSTAISKGPEAAADQAEICSHREPYSYPPALGYWEHLERSGMLGRVGVVSANVGRGTSQKQKRKKKRGKKKLPKEKKLRAC